MAAKGYAYLTDHQVNVLRRSAPNIIEPDMLPKLIDNALQIIASEMPTGIPQANVAGLVTDLGLKLTAAKLVKYSSAASAGGAATEAVTVTGLAVGDTILAVTQRVAGANGTALNGWNTQILNGVTLSWTANPGAGSIVDVLVLKA
jgi:hypothetical protein